jgi:hypothetical protein
MLHPTQVDKPWVPAGIKGIDWTVAIDKQQYEAGSCGMCIELTGKGKGKGGAPVVGTYRVFVNNEGATYMHRHTCSYAHTGTPSSSPSTSRSPHSSGTWCRTPSTRRGRRCR